MKPFLRALILICGLCLVSICHAAQSIPAFDRWLDQFSTEWMRGNPMGATAAQYFSGREQDALDRRLTPITKKYRAARVALARRALAELKQFDLSQLKQDQRVSAAMLEWQLDDIIRGEPFRDHEFVFQQMNGLQINIVNSLTQTHPIRNRRDIENYLARLGLVAGQIKEGISQAKERADCKIIPPRFILEATIGQFNRFLSDPPEKNVFVATLNERAAKLKDLSEKDRAKFVAAARNIVSKQIIPAFDAARATLKSQIPWSTDAAGISNLPDGDKAYAYFLRRYTTTSMTPKEVHELGLKEVKRIEGEMESLLQSLGYASGSIKERMEKLEADSQPPATPDPRPKLLSEFERIIRDAEKRSALIFDLRPKAPVEVRREPPFTEKNAAAHYTVPARDGSRPGTFWAPLPGPTFKITNMRTLAYHEAVPGHHFQVALQNEMTSLPRYRQDRIFGLLSAFAEGWALYAEQLAAENGWYEGDVKGRLGQLDGELFRARRLVVDTGLHTMDWTRQQAIDYGIPVSEVERYVVYPGQACSYKIGMLKILELRAKAQKALGPKFSIKEFHNVLLRNGTVPLGVLETIVDDYIASARR